MSDDAAVEGPFQELSRGALCWPQQRAIVKVKGADARGFLHRMSTQHVEALAPQEARLNALTNKQGRIVDVVHHINVSDDEVLLVGMRDEGAGLIEWLDEFLFVEKVELEDLTGQGSLALVAGAQAMAVCSRLLASDVTLAPWAAAFTGDRVAVRGFDLLGEDGLVPSVLVWGRSGDERSISAALADAGAHEGSADDLEIARVATGVPGPAEANERYNPLELALHDAIHWAKGCYIGQEVIARIDNYGKQSRQLVGLLVEHTGDVGIVAGAEVRGEGKAIGEVTSVSPRVCKGRPSALAVLKLRGEIEGTVVDVARDGAGGVQAIACRRAAQQQPHD